MANCRQACPYNTLDGCKVKEYNAICPLTNMETPVTEYRMTNADRIRAMSDEEGLAGGPFEEKAKDMTEKERKKRAKREAKKLLRLYKRAAKVMTPPKIRRAEKLANISLWISSIGLLLSVIALLIRILR